MIGLTIGCELGIFLAEPHELVGRRARRTAPPRCWEALLERVELVLREVRHGAFSRSSQAPAAPTHSSSSSRMRDAVRAVAAAPRRPSCGSAASSSAEHHFLDRTDRGRAHREPRHADRHQRQRLDRLAGKLAAHGERHVVAPAPCRRCAERPQPRQRDRDRSSCATAGWRGRRRSGTCTRSFEPIETKSASGSSWSSSNSSEGTSIMAPSSSLRRHRLAVRAAAARLPC